MKRVELAGGPPVPLVVVREGAHTALRFDPVAATIFSHPTPVAPAVGLDLVYGRGAFTASDNGVLAYRRTAAQPRRLVNIPLDPAPPTSIVVTLNWDSGLAR